MKLINTNKPFPKKFRAKRVKQLMMYLWNNWLEQNRHQFTYPPVVREINKDILILEFAGINPKITARFWFETQSFAIYYDIENDGNYWDFLVDFDIHEEQAPDGQFFCYYCKGLDITYYPTRQALWEQHVFEVLLAWCNANFRPDRVAVVSGNYREDGFDVDLLTKEQVQSLGYANTPSVSVVIDIESEADHAT